MMLREPVAIIDCCRSPFGRLGGALAGYEAHELLARIFRQVTDTSPGDLDEVIVESVRDGIGNSARVAAVRVWPCWSSCRRDDNHRDREDRKEPPCRLRP